MPETGLYEVNLVIGAKMITDAVPKVARWQIFPSLTTGFIGKLDPGAIAMKFSFFEQIKTAKTRQYKKLNKNY